MDDATVTSSIQIPAGQALLDGDLVLPLKPRGLVLFAHGSGSSRRSPRNRMVARELERAGFATLLMDLLTADEERVDQRTTHLRFDIGLLALRLVHATDWVDRHPVLRTLPLGYFGASTGAGAALVAAAERPARIAAVVSRGGRPDLAGPALRLVRAPTLLIVGGEYHAVIDLNRQAKAAMPGQVDLAIVPGATHLFEEPGALEHVARLAVEWFARWGAERTS
jgi:dienelactone hydrolase